MEKIGEIANKRYETLNVNVKRYSLKENKTLNVKRYGKYSTHIDNIAERMADVLNDAKSLYFFKKCASKLPESMIWDIIESAKRPGIDNPARYATAAMRNQLQRLQ